MSTDISMQVIKRLPRYYRYLGDLLNDGVERVSSAELSDIMHVTASQIRQDLNNFGGFGQQGYGYNVQYLHEEIGRILGLNEEHNIILLGAGNLGSAIANYVKFERHGFHIIALFDKNPDLIGKEIRDIPVYSIDDLEDFVGKNKVDIAALTMPKDNAVEVAKRVADAGVKAIWNFAHVDLYNLEGVKVENVHLSDSLMQLTYAISGDHE